MKNKIHTKNRCIGLMLPALAIGSIVMACRPASSDIEVIDDGLDAPVSVSTQAPSAALAETTPAAASETKHESSGNTASEPAPESPAPEGTTAPAAATPSATDAPSPAGTAIAQPATTATPGTVGTPPAATSPGTPAASTYAVSTSTVKFKVPYSFGAHDGTAQNAKGQMLASVDDSIALQSAHFEVPITGMTTGNATRDCHMREALGINYQGSRFPKNHVCSQNKTPASGPDSIAFPTITFDADAITITSANKVLKSGAVTASVSGTWTVHGQKRSKTISLKLQSDAEGRTISASGTTQLQLSEFGVVVIPFAGAVTVGNVVTVDLNLNFVKQ